MKVFRETENELYFTFPLPLYVNQLIYNAYLLKKQIIELNQKA